ncbi:MAG TPA: hypothetical protein VG734_23020 [Lacunisphaera sp.]|nr:hypothetical protein [Lacunisphaera sp.]
MTSAFTSLAARFTSATHSPRPAGTIISASRARSSSAALTYPTIS